MAIYYTSPVQEMHHRSRFKGRFKKIYRWTVKAVAMIWLTLMKEKALIGTEFFCCKDNMIFFVTLYHKVESFCMRRSISLLCHCYFHK